MSDKVYIIIHTDTRVVRRVTSIDPPEVGPDETAVLHDPTLDLAAIPFVPWKLSIDGKSAEAPTEDEVRAASVPPMRPAVAAVLQAIEGVENDPEVPESVRNVVRAIADLIFA